MKQSNWLTTRGLLLLAIIAGMGCPASGNGEHDGDEHGDAEVANCNGGGCEMTLEDFQTGYPACGDNYDSFLRTLQNAPGPCSYALYTCEGMRALGVQVSFVANVQCFYDDAGALVGGKREWDQGLGGFFGEVPEVPCPRANCIE